MTAHIIGTWEPGSPEWLAARRFRIGGSEIGTVLGFNRFESRADLLDVKLGLKPPRPNTEAMDRGTRLEEAVVNWFCDTRNLTLLPDSKATYVHDDHDFLLFNPDGLLSDGTLLEVKTAKVKDTDHGWGRANTDQVPLTYAAQVQWGMHCLDIRIAHIAVLFGDPFAFRAYHIKYDPTIANYLVQQGAEFAAALTTHQQKAA